MSAYRFDDHRLDVDRQLLQCGDRVVSLSPKLFGILHCLVRAAGRTVTKDELISSVWEREDVSDATIVQHIWILRRLLDERANSHRYILTVPRKGYRFVPRVTYAADTAVTGAIAIADPSQRGEPRVWREYFSGIRYAEKRDRSGCRLALKHFNAALSLDPTFAPAWTGVAGACSNMAFYAFATWDHVLPMAMSAVTKAIYFDPTSALAHCVLAQIRLAQWDVLEAERSLDRAGNLDARSPAVYQLSSFIQAWRGESEPALANAKRTVALVPSDIAAQGIFASALALQGDFTNAIASYTNILEAEPACRIARQGRCEVYAASGELQLARKDLELLPRTAANVSRLACVNAFRGDTLGASRLFKELEQRSTIEYVEPHCFAQIHIALGRYDEAVRLTEKAVASHDIAFPGMLSSPLLAEPMKDRKLRQMLGDVRNLLCKPRRKIG
ncbi:MAG TPA: winged helix-turn-helix domain-containing protein [Candidatus Cybelea sp.]|jgi:DNA-binding winged helix-turn-helix (wHTH) protein/tetratricopeptide (TPR) repeat protein|nr:winged helix-turn-helix domain-containing protein [Candidatus Cybelea sp.]